MPRVEISVSRELQLTSLLLRVSVNCSNRRSVTMPEAQIALHDWYVDRKIPPKSSESQDIFNGSHYRMWGFPWHAGREEIRKGIPLLG